MMTPNVQSSAYGHGGNTAELARHTGTSLVDWLDLSASLNPLGRPPGLLNRLRAGLDEVVRYPDHYSRNLCQALASHHETEEAAVLVGNGATELLFLLTTALPHERTLIPVPTYVDYERASLLAGGTLDFIELFPEDDFCLDLPRLGQQLRPGDLVLLGHPNNPTGCALDVSALHAVAAAAPSALFVVDESFADLAGCSTTLSPDHPNILVLRSLTKTFAIPGLRLGYLVGATDLVQMCRQHQPPWSVNALALRAGLMVADAGEYVRRSRIAVRDWRRDLLARLAPFPGLHPVPGCANFLLLHLTDPQLDAVDLYESLLQEPIVIRPCARIRGLGRHWFRVAVSTPENHERLCSALTARLLPVAP